MLEHSPTTPAACGLSLRVEHRQGEDGRLDQVRTPALLPGRRGGRRKARRVRRDELTAARRALLEDRGEHVVEVRAKEVSVVRLADLVVALPLVELRDRSDEARRARSGRGHDFPPAGPEVRVGDAAQTLEGNDVVGAVGTLEALDLQVRDPAGFLPGRHPDARPEGQVLDARVDPETLAHAVRVPVRGRGRDDLQRAGRLRPAGVEAGPRHLPGVRVRVGLRNFPAREVRGERAVRDQARDRLLRRGGGGQKREEGREDEHAADVNETGGCAARSSWTGSSR